MLDWPYAQLVVDAQAAGGPEQFQNLLISTGVNYGRQSMYPYIAASFGGGIVVCWGISKIIDFHKQRKRKKEVLFRQQIVDEVSRDICSELVHSKRKIKNLVIVNSKA